MLRHDPSRTGASTNASDLLEPTVVWRYYLGGSATSAQIMADDVDQDGKVDLLIISGGRLIAKQPDDVVLWETPAYSLRRIDALVDLDGDGKREIIATGHPGFVGVFAGHDGALLWRTDPAAIGAYIGAVRLADFNGDGLPDLYVADMACGSRDSQYDVAYAFSFAKGFLPRVDDGETQRLWQLERGRRYSCGLNDTLADVTGDGVADVIAFATSEALLFDGKTGKKIPSGNTALKDGYDLGFPLPYGHCASEVLDVDGDERQEVLCFTNRGDTPAGNTRAVFMLRYDPTRPTAERLHVAWIKTVADQMHDRHRYVANSVADLDADGTLELVTTFTEGGVTTTYVLDAATGTVRLSLAGKMLRGVLRLPEQKLPLVVTSTGADNDVFRFEDLSQPWPAPAFKLPQGSLRSYHDRRRARTMSGVTLPLTVPLASGRTGIVTGSATKVYLYDVEGDKPVELAQRALPEEISVVSLAPQSGIYGSGHGLLLVRSDGFLEVLNDALVAINFRNTNEFPIPGARVGGYYSGASGLGPVPVAAPLGAGDAADVLVRDSRGRLLRLDVKSASLSKRIAPVWSWAAALYPSMIDLDGDGALEIVARVGGLLQGRRSDGETIVFSTNVSATGFSGFSDPVPARGADNALHFVMTQHNGTSGTSRLVRVDSEGNVVWTSPEVYTSASGRGYPTIDNLDDDGHDDVLAYMKSPLRYYDGKDGALLATGKAGHCAMPIVVRGRADPVTHICGGHVSSPVGFTVSKPLDAAAPATDVWDLGEYGALRWFGAVVECPNKRLVFANTRSNATRLAIVDAADGQNRKDLWLARGALFSSEAAYLGAAKLGGILGNVTATPDIGDGTPAFVVGSTDGHLYAIDACSTPGKLKWAIDFRAPVGEAIFADTDGDGADEIVVTSADGFIYGVDTQALPAPKNVWDIDPAWGRLDDDVDVTRGPEVVARWDAVPGAQGYEYAVFTLGGTPLSRNPDDETNPFIPTAETRASFRRQLKQGAYFVFAVRAIGPDGTSAEVLTDGTRWEPLARPEADGGVGDGGAGDAGVGDAGVYTTREMSGGCACRLPANQGLGTGSMALWLALALLRRRSRKTDDG